MSQMSAKRVEPKNFKQPNSQNVTVSNDQKIILGIKNFPENGDIINYS